MPKLTLRALLMSIVGAIVAAAPGGAGAATPLLISPTIVKIAAARKGAVIEISNQSDEAVDLHLRGYDWSQPDGRDALLPSASLVVSPAIATLAPRSKQIFRILDQGPPGSREKAFRIRINELPPPGRRDAIAINLEFLLPVFRTGGEGAADLHWTRGGGTLALENRGGSHVRLIEAKLVTPDGRASPIAGAASTYVLAGNRRVFAAAAQAGDRLVGTTDLGPFDVLLPVSGE